MRQSSERSALLTWLVRTAPIALFVAGIALAPACSCGDEKGPTVGANNGEPDTDLGDTDGGQDIGGDTPDAPGDVPADAADAPDTPDAPDDAADVPDAPLTQWADSCLFAVLDCFGSGLAPNSCTINQVTGFTAVSYGNRRATRWVADGAGYIFDAFADGAGCYEARGGDPNEGPNWAILDRQQASFGVRVAGETTTVTCSDGTVERMATDQIQPWLPEILSPEDPLCGLTRPRSFPFHLPCC